MNSKLDQQTPGENHQKSEESTPHSKVEVVERRIPRKRPGEKTQSRQAVDQERSKDRSAAEEQSQKRKQNAEVKIKFLESSKALEGAPEKILPLKLMREEFVVKVDFEFADFNTGNFNQSLFYGECQFKIEPEVEYEQDYYQSIQ